MPTLLQGPSLPLLQRVSGSECDSRPLLNVVSEAYRCVLESLTLESSGVDVIQDSQVLPCRLAGTRKTYVPFNYCISWQ